MSQSFTLTGLQVQRVSCRMCADCNLTAKACYAHRQCLCVCVCVLPGLPHGRALQLRAPSELAAAVMGKKTGTHTQHLANSGDQKRSAESSYEHGVLCLAVRASELCACSIRSRLKAATAGRSVTRAIDITTFLVLLGLHRNQA